MIDLIHAALAALVAAFAGPPAPVPPSTVTVAAVVYSDYTEGERDWSACGPDEGTDYEPCEVESLIRRAHGQGAELIVVSEAALGGLEEEVPPIVGLRPAADAPLQLRFSDVAMELQVWLVIELDTEADEDHSYLTQIAYDPGGVVVAVHHKLELYRGELDSYLPGSTVTAFDTPFGRVGLLICSDLYTDPRRHEEMVSDLGVDIVALSSVWTVGEAHHWQAAFAHDWGVTLIAANGAIGDGIGAGIFAPDGHPLAATRRPQNHVVTADIPRP